jgi:hypothetical protein
MNDAFALGLIAPLVWATIWGIAKILANGIRFLLRHQQPTGRPRP